MSVVETGPASQTSYPSVSYQERYDKTYLTCALGAKATLLPILGLPPPKLIVCTSSSLVILVVESTRVSSSTFSLDPPKLGIGKAFNIDLRGFYHQPNPLTLLDVQQKPRDKGERFGEGERTYSSTPS